MSVLRRAYVEVLPDTKGFDPALTEQLKRKDSGGKAGKLLGGQLNRALSRLDLPAIDVKADPKVALAAIDAVENRLQKLGREAETVEVKVRTEKALGELNRFKRQLGDVGDDGGEEAATGFAARFSTRLGPLLASAAATPPVAAGGATLGAALAPTLAAGLGGALAAGVGAGAIFAGIKLIAKDPQVAEAGKAVGERFSRGVALEAETFKLPVLGALKEIDAFASRTTPKIGAIFRNVSPQVEGLTKNLTAAGDAIVDSLSTASANSAGPLKALGDGVQNIGTAFAGLVDTLSRRGPEGTAAINDLTGAATNAIKATTAIADGAAAVKGWTGSVDGAIDRGRVWVEDQSGLSNALSKVGISLDITADGYKKNSAAGELYRQGVIGINGSLNDYDHYVSQANSATNDLANSSQQAERPQRALIGTLSTADRAARGERDAMVALSNQLRAQTDPAFALINAQNTLKTAQDKAAEATKKHGRNSVEARTATRNLASAAIDLQGKAGALSASFNGKLTPSMRHTLEAAGLTKNQIAAVGREFRSAKKDGDKFAKNYKATTEVTGGGKVNSELWRLSLLQQALKKGNAPPAAYGTLNKVLRGARLASGGKVPGSSPTKTADNVPAMLTADEWVHPVDSVNYYGRDFMEAIQKRQIPRERIGYAGGGQVARWPYPVNAAQTRVPSMKEVLSKVIPEIPSGGRTSDFIVRAAKMLVPGIRVLSKDRPGAMTLTGNRSYHSMGRAVDFEANKTLAQRWNQHYGSRTKEEITPWQQYNLHNGQRHTYTGAVWNQHNFAGGNAHDHIAMAGGGVIREPVVGVGRSGRSYSFAERGPETVTPGTGAGGDIHLHFHNSVIASRKQAEDLVVTALRDAKRRNLA